MLSRVIRSGSPIRFLLALVPLALSCACATAPAVQLEGSENYLEGVGRLQSLNGAGLPAEADSDVLRFGVCGHLYGDPAPWSVFPAQSLTRSVVRIDSENLDLFVALGDTFKRYEEPYITTTKRVLHRMSMPVFNAPGNHDLTDPEAYVRDNGPTFGALAFRGCLLVVLDTELGAGSITDEQLDFLRAVVASAADDEGIHSVFFFAHKLLFAQRPRYTSVAERVNDTDKVRSGNFAGVIQPLIQRLVPDKGVYWFGGDIGVADSRSLFYDRDPATGINFVAAGLGDTDRDAYIIVEARASGEVVLTPVSMSGEQLRPLEYYGIETWR